MTRSTARGFSPTDVSAFDGGPLWRTGAKLVVTSLEGAHLGVIEPTQPDAPGVP
jgi:hypothetical protein